MGALCQLPGSQLVCPKFCPFGGMPADSRRVEENLGPGQSSQSRCLGVPLVPTDKHTDFTERRVNRLKPQITRCEIIFFIEKRVIGDMHFPVRSKQCSIGAVHQCRVVIQTRGSSLK